MTTTYYSQLDKEEIDKRLGWLDQAYQAATATSNYALRDLILGWVKERFGPKKRK